MQRQHLLEVLLQLVAHVVDAAGRHHKVHAVLHAVPRQLGEVLQRVLEQLREHRVVIQQHHDVGPPPSRRAVAAVVAAVVGKQSSTPLHLLVQHLQKVGNPLLVAAGHDAAHLGRVLKDPQRLRAEVQHVQVHLVRRVVPQQRVGQHRQQLRLAAAHGTVDQAVALLCQR